MTINGIRRKSLGYRQALALLEAGEQMVWHHYPASRATINGVTVRYDAYLKLRKEYKAAVAKRCNWSLTPKNKEAL